MDDIPIYPFSLEEIKKYPDRGNDVFFRRSNEMIDIGFNNGMDKITLFKIKDDSGFDLFLNLPATSWQSTLVDSISYFESIEDYEECAYARDVLEKISD